ncbi:Fatty acid synthase [Holothuria leucospilota]|uniref:Fatty acid synthase n=1 Tax=Holothuria leucospilota TaxID=206669 RepID=A0A9Q1HH04_HOLLE|nr:Fatty acid synthase [Holothuria leucospilota]
MANSEKIVACGMSGRLPESDDLHEFWDHLMNKDNLVKRNFRRWDSEFLKLPGGSGLLKDISRFDASFFGMLPKQVNKTDPQLRILLEVAYEAIVDAGFNPRELEGSNTGVYVASSYSEANIVFAGDMQATDGYAFTGSIPAFLSNRLSYWFDFKGPSYTLDAVCASGLLVVQIAMKDILSGQCDYALVGAVSTTLRPQLTHMLNQLQVQSPDGTCKSFDKSANGYVRAESVVAVFITRESLCRRVYGHLVHSVVNHSGFSQQGISFPSLEAQTNLLSKAYSEAGISPNEVEFIETHGTGTKAGDPTEAQALNEVFCQHRPKTKPLLIGAVKTNMGHSECAAGLSSLIKVLLTINEGVIPPNLHFNEPDPCMIGLVDGSLKVVTEKTNYLGGPIGVNAFGFGGLNVHTIVKPYYVNKQDFPCTIPKIVISSGRTKEGVMKSLKYLATNMTDGTFQCLLSQVAHSPVEKMPYRGYTIQIGKNSTEHVQKVQVSGKRPVWFVFTGMGSQWPGMGRDLMVIDTFRKSIEKCHKALEAADSNIQLIDLILSGTKEKVNETVAAFVTTTSIQVALVNCLKDLGVSPDGMVGHSMGETACAFADECMSEEQTIMAIYWRARCVLNGNPPSGCMASVGLGWDEVKARIPEGVVAACQNAEDNTTISGNVKAIEAFVSEMESQGVFARIVNTGGIAYHSPDMFPIAPALQTALQKVITKSIPISTSWISTSVPENQMQTEQAKLFNSSYLVNNLVSPVRFCDAVRKIPSKAIVIEIAPHGLMQAILKRSLHTESDCISLMSKKESDNFHYFMSKIGQLFTFGLTLDLKKLYPPIEYPVGTGTPMLSPGIKWDHCRKWVVPSWEEFLPDSSIFTKTINVGDEDKDSFVKDHNIDGQILYPATGYIILAWQAIAYMMRTVSEKLPIEFEEITIHRATVMSESGDLKFTIHIEQSANSFSISETDELVVSGTFKIPENPFVSTKQGSPVHDDSLIVFQEDFYKELRLMGYNYGPRFQGVKRSTVEGKYAVLEWNGNWITFLDTMLQMVVFGKENPSRSLFLPTRIRKIRINPAHHTSKTMGGPNVSEILVSVDTVLGTCCSGGVEIEGLYIAMLQKRKMKETVTLESLEFVPYGKGSIPLPSDVQEYGKICKEYLSIVLRNIPYKNSMEDLNARGPNNFEENDFKARLTPYLSYDDCGYSKVLHEIGKVERGNDFLKTALDIIDSHALEIVHDKLLSHLLKSHSFKNMLDVVWENSNTRKVKVVEIGARFGGLFNFVAPCMMSQPLLELDLTATDTHVEKLFNAFENQLEVFKVKTDFLDINRESIDLEAKNLVVVRGLAQQSKNIKKTLQNIYSILIDGGFLLLHEITSNSDTLIDCYEITLGVLYNVSCDTVSKSCLACADWEDVIQDTGFELIQQISDDALSTLFLCRKRKLDATENNAIIISVSGKDFNWVEDVKNELRYIQGQDNSSRIWLISENNSQSGIVGLVNCLRQEDGGDKIRCLFNTSQNSDTSTPLNELPQMQQLLRTDLVMNIFKNGCWGSYRHQFLNEEEFFTTPKNAHVDVLSPGNFSSLQWIHSLDDPTSRERCTVHYSSLNFRDVMLASGKLPPGSVPENLAHRECLIGIEFAGLNSEGKRVMGIIENQGLAWHVFPEPCFLFDVPESWTLEDAATVPVVYSTVFYALVVRGQVKCGESILIHSGSGGVGQAAIAVALSYGCKVYTTVGTQEKRQFLMQKFPTLTQDCFASSRDSSFQRHIMRQTNGLGVNLVLNSLSGELFEASLRCLSMSGRFLEIGKYDLSQNKQIGSLMFLNNTSFHGVHLDRLFGKGHPDWPAVAFLMKEGLRNGIVKPLPRTVFDQDEVESAFRYMAKGTHIGKVLINLNPTEKSVSRTNQLMSVKPRQSCDQNKVYLIVGGLGGFGLELANWLVSRGCKKLVITTRAGIRNGYQSRCFLRWLSLGVVVELSQLDVSKLSDCNNLLRQCQNMGPIGGIFNMAMVLKDALLDNLTSADFQEVCNPKLKAASNLDQATRRLCGPELDWFVMFSSVSSGRGNGGQSNYGFANSAMERICENRREEQLPALAIQWGVIGDVGVVADSETGNDTVIVGCAAQTLHSCLSTLDLFLSTRKPVLASLVKARSKEDTVEVNRNEDISNMISKLFGIDDISSVNQDKTLAEIGLDSILVTGVKQTLERHFSYFLNVKQIRSLTIRKLLNFDRERLQDENENDRLENSKTDAHLPLISPILSCKTTNCLVQLNTGSIEKDPIFLFHPIEGSIDVFRPLASTLLDYPVFAVQFTKEVPKDSISNVANYYLSNIRAVKASGPYHLAGYSFGAVVALEIARILQNDANDQSETKLFFFDGSPSYVTIRFRVISEISYPLGSEVIEVLGQRGTLEIRSLCHFLQLCTSISFEEIKQQLLQKSTYKTRLDLVVQILLKMTTGINQDDITFSIDSFVKRIVAVMEYQPKGTWESDMVLFKAESCNNEILKECDSEDHHLSKLCSGKVEVYTIEGDHVTIMQDPGVQTISKIMKDIL